ncbi:MAG: hypothetical protein IKE03_02425 [Blautia sp.]|nr:hypothetical protein [Blautia sp.]
MRKDLLTVVLSVICAFSVLIAATSYQNTRQRLQRLQMTDEADTIEDYIAKMDEADREASGEAEEETGPTPTPGPTPTIVITNPAAPVLTLVTDRLEIQAGGSFNNIGQVSDITDDKDDRYTLFRRIQIHGNYNTSVPGEYLLQYLCSDTDGNLSPVRDFTLVVK